MSVNRSKPHILVLPEDDANRQLAKAFELILPIGTRQFYVHRPAGGWLKVLDTFNADHAEAMRRNQLCHFILLIDFDSKPGRLSEAIGRIPPELRHRSYILGSFSDPEKLRASLGKSLEDIGKTLGRDCKLQTDSIWKHPLLSHNSQELARLEPTCRAILFPDA